MLTHLCAFGKREALLRLRERLRNTTEMALSLGKVALHYRAGVPICYCKLEVTKD